MTGVDLEKCKRIVQYFWDPEPKNDAAPDASIWCLGEEYKPLSPQDPPPIQPTDPVTRTWPASFLDDFESRIWMTYRSNFPPIPRNNTSQAASSMTLSVRLRSQLMDTQGFTSDTGWGLRANKTLIATLKDPPSTDLMSIGRILSSECDNPTLRVYVTNDTSDVYEDQFTRLARDESGHIQPTLILLGLRLGIEHVTPVYWDGLRAAFQYPQSVGVAGGRPSASHYFVGVQDSHLFFLDPHTTRSGLPPRIDDAHTAEELDTYHTRRLRRIPIQEMDPSMLIGFLIQDDADWTDWKKRVQSTAGKPIIHIIAAGNSIDVTPGRKEALDEVEVLDDSDALL
ncbi:cysteine protease atg4 [Penicillium macrosclerotiorum]|uniref:cysteine protease atg4 n=1 Tax=Penicillium macrosclerotiorum TaxID=303699 RepID=UPI002549C0CE|nr:cysteine protease atg4 [Penicillium macrosclerotiorum]KAJ5692069.1 cysteine protease atg4 [Penicillium macrosclerotiorum]